MGIVLPLILGATLALAVAYVVAKRRRKSGPGGA
jgi:LPXTG-motif cell wall-anchored protein